MMSYQYDVIPIHYTYIRHKVSLIINSLSSYYIMESKLTSYKSYYCHPRTWTSSQVETKMRCTRANESVNIMVLLNLGIYIVGLLIIQLFDVIITFLWRLITNFVYTECCIQYTLYKSGFYCDLLMNWILK